METCMDNKNNIQKIPEIVKRIGWICLSGLMLFPMLPRSAPYINICGALSLTILVANFFIWKVEILPNRYLKISFWLFIFTMAINVFIPPLLAGTSYSFSNMDKIITQGMSTCVGFGDSVSAAYRTLCGIAAVGMAVLTLRSFDDLRNALYLWIGCAAIVLIFGIVDGVIRLNLFDNPLRRIQSIKGNTARYAESLLPTGFALSALWCLWLKDKGKWFLFSGAAIASAMIAIRFKGANFRNISLKIAQNNPTIMYSITCIITAILGFALAYLILKSRKGLLVVGALFLSNIVLTGTRWTIASVLIVSTCVTSAFHKWRLTLYIIIVVIISSVTLLKLHPRFQNDNFRIRKFIYVSGINLIKDHKWLGAGYGSDSVRRTLPPYRANPDDFAFSEKDKIREVGHVHLHNFWLELLAERGIVGFLSFHLMWITFIITAWLGGRGNQIARLSAIWVFLLPIFDLLTFSMRDGLESQQWLVAGMGLVSLRLMKHTK